MSLEENKAIVRRFVEAYNKQNLDLLDDLVSPDEPVGIILNFGYLNSKVFAEVYGREFIHEELEYIVLVWFSNPEIYSFKRLNHRDLDMISS